MDVLEELTEFEPQIDKARVERQVEDWAQRVGSLYDSMVGWLPDLWIAERRGSTPMGEELMRRFGVQERELPILHLTREGSAEAVVEPRGLWIIGANGRLDLVRGDQHYFIVDSAGIFEQPKWSIAPFMARRDRRTFDREALRAVLT